MGHSCADGQFNEHSLEPLGDASRRLNKDLGTTEIHHRAGTAGEVANLVEWKCHRRVSLLQAP